MHLFFLLSFYLNFLFVLLLLLFYTSFLKLNTLLNNKDFHIHYSMIQHIINTNIHLLYKQTEITYAHDDEVDKDDLQLLCNHLYQHDILRVFKLTDYDINSLSSHIHTLFKLLTIHPAITALIQTHFFIDDITTFYTLFSYDLLYITYPIIVHIANTHTPQALHQALPQALPQAPPDL